MDLREIGWKVVDWVDLAQDRDSGRDFCDYYLLKKDSDPWN
jgi:hypothetical protein